MFSALGVVLLSATSYCVFLSLINFLGELAFPGCSHPVKCYDFQSELRDSLDSSVNPCDDLYDHVCASFPFRYPLAGSQFGVLNTRTQLMLLELLGKPRDAHSISAVDKITRGYQKCIGVLSEEQENSDVIRALLKQYNFEWPSLEVKQGFDHLDLTVGLTLDYNIAFLVGMTVFPYFRTDKKYSLVLSSDQGFISTLNELIDIENENTIMDCIAAFASVPDGDRAEMAKIIAEVYRDYQAAAKLADSDFLANYTKFADMQYVSPTITASQWINTINKHLPSAVHVKGSDEVLLFSDAMIVLRYILPDYNRKMSHLLLFHGYVLIAKLAHMFSYRQLSCKNLLLPKYHPQFTGLCLATVNQMAPFAVARIVFDEILDPSSVNFTVDIYGNVRRETQKSFRTLSWMVEEGTRKAAADRVGSIVEIEGTPADLSSRKELDEFYGYLPPFSRSFIQDYLEANRLRMNKMKGLLNVTNMTVHRDHIDVSYIDVNAFYIPLLHMMVIPGAILQSPFVSTAIPTSASYGSIGHVLGHELTHAFDPVLGKITPTGDIVDWYDPKSEAAFMERVQCLEDQVNVAAGSTTLGNNSFSEAYADNAGMEKVVFAYKSQNKRSDSLLGYTADQLFFISACFTFCSFSKTLIPNDQKYPSFGLRCILPAGNSEMFSDVFRCPKGARMNFRHRCKFHA